MRYIDNRDKTGSFLPVAAWEMWGLLSHLGFRSAEDEILEVRALAASVLHSSLLDNRQTRRFPAFVLC